MPISPSNQPFWQDEPEDQLYTRQTIKRVFPLLKIYGIAGAFFFLSLIFTLLYLLSSILAWAWVVLLIILFGSTYYRNRQKKSRIQSILQVQQRAHDSSGASLIGSAIHVAGHPKLEREQNIVMALIVSHLVIYSYQSDQPLTSIPLQQIESVQTVVYDDDRIPHTDVVDSSAQAIQLTIRYGNQEIACLFRKMKPVRPIDWYHAIQKARVEENIKAG